MTLTSGAAASPQRSRPARVTEDGHEPHASSDPAGPRARARAGAAGVQVADADFVGVFGRPVAPYTFETAFRRARGTVGGLPEGFRVHDLRHYFASLLIASGLDVKTVQTRLRHSSAKTTLDTYGHIWPDRDDSTRAAVSEAFATRPLAVGE
ncbi:tyrosine-type recombinase/integrase [Microbacterium sp. Root180]|uniref:tyrosine-type recombinase/integrase n=1 Tax=Microbacterium sp. Root180 TaxID=1736483 RepID=UPI0009EA8CB9|nr:tyrosine-type recombinase/integrase [Microbacterium sp. Root180]